MSGRMLTTEAGSARRTRVALVLFFAVLAIAPFLVGDFLLSVLVIILYFAFVGQAWNLMMGYAGQLSLGHALYVGIGAYASAALFVHFGIPPLIGAVPAMALAALVGASIGWLAFRFRIGGVYFALLTIAFAEFTRLLVSHIGWLGATEGFFLPIENRTDVDLVALRGPPPLFYYIFLVLTGGALLAIRRIMDSRLGYYWLAIREDETAAEAAGINVFRYKMIAVMISAAMTALAGIVTAFYYNNLFPTDVFGIHRSIEIILAPIVGGLGTLFGPIVGAFVLGILGEGLTIVLDQAGIATAGVKHLVYAVFLFLIVRFLPGGLWPWLAARLGLDRDGPA